MLVDVPIHQEAKPAHHSVLRNDFQITEAVFPLGSEDHSLKKLYEAHRDCLSALSGDFGETEALRGTQLGSITLSQD